jgi:hypothetical protein
MGYVSIVDVDCVPRNTKCFIEGNRERERDAIRTSKQNNMCLISTHNNNNF